jgi:hypothetical protein
MARSVLKARRGVADNPRALLGGQTANILKSCQSLHTKAGVPTGDLDGRTKKDAAALEASSNLPGQIRGAADA